ncbi:MAG: UDP-N-acetylglucosamine 1-carboxyvinyltransferase [Candidatus Levybacteria bacterium]|nr:UDP-N-acetylglucosamine 1-carboxyvinyltransferase [Candidatus Levybacteria bacterium]
MTRKYLIKGGKSLSGTIRISGSKNVVTKAVIAACLTDEPVTLKNVPEITDNQALLEIIESIGGTVERGEGQVTITVKEVKNHELTLAEGARVRTSSMFLAPLLLRVKKAIVPNPEGCRLGARSIERHIEGLEKMGAVIEYRSEDGYFHASTEGLIGTNYRFEKNTHTGTETMIMAATLAKGITTIENAAEEHEIDDLISLLNSMGAKIQRVESRKIVIEGVERLHGTTYEIVSDANELVTFAVLSVLSGGNITLSNVNLDNVEIFLQELGKSGVEYEKTDDCVRFFASNGLNPSSIVTAPEPGFKTDWQGPWAILMTQARGESVIHETIYENRFGYVSELKKMGAKIDYINPQVENPESFYNFNYNPKTSYRQAIKITGPQKLHDAVLKVSDLRAGATVVIGALLANGQSIVYGIEHIERGYEKFAQRLRDIGADIVEEEEDY